MKPPANIQAAVLLTGALLTGAVVATETAQLPPAFSARYALSINGISAGETVRTLTRLAVNRYVFSSSTHATGFASWFLKDTVFEESTWSSEGNSIRPLHYAYHRTGGKKQRHVEVDFDWDKRVIHNTAEGHTWQMPAVDNVLDKLVHQIALMRDMGTAGAELIYPVADGGKTKSYRFRLGEKQLTDTPYGEFTTIKLERIREDDKRSTVFWCAPDLNYLPIRIEHSKKGGHKTILVLKDLSGLR